jgi:hypothetical protein
MEFHPFGIVGCMISLSRRTKEEIITMKFLRLEGVVKNRDQRFSFTRNLILISSLGINKTIPSGLLAFGDANPEGMEYSWRKSFIVPNPEGVTEVFSYVIRAIASIPLRR